MRLLVQSLVLWGLCHTVFSSPKYFTGPVNPDVEDLDGVQVHPDAESRPSTPGNRLFKEFVNDDNTLKDEPELLPKRKKGSKASLPVKAARPSAPPREPTREDFLPDFTSPESFLDTVLAWPIDIQAAEDACRTLPPGPITVPRARVPAQANLTGYVADDVAEVPVQDLLLSHLPAQPEAIGILACLAEAGVINASAPPDKGAKMVYIAAARKHMRLLSTLLEQGGSSLYVQPEGGQGVLHAALDPSILSLDMAVSLLKAHRESTDEDANGHALRKLKGSLAKSPGMKTVVKKGAASQAAAYPRWLGRIVEAIGKHLPSYVGDEVTRAYKELISMSTVVNSTGGLLAEADHPGPLAALDLVHAKHLRTIANGYGTLVMRIVMEAQLQTALRQSKTGRVHVSSSLLKESGGLDQPTGVGFATAVTIIRHLETRDRNGRTPVHYAALYDNDAAISHMTLAVRRLALAAWNHANATGQEELPGQEGFIRAVIATLVTGPDVLGHTPRDIACSLGHSRSAALLYATELAARSAEKPRPADACKDAKGGQERKVKGGVPHKRTGASGWDALTLHPSELASSAVQAAIARAVARGSGAMAVDSQGQATGVKVQVSGSGGQTRMPPSCDIDVVSASSLSPNTFFTEYVLAGRPVLVRGSEDGQRLVQAWGMRDVLARAGELHFPLGDIPYAKAFGRTGSGVSLSLRDYVTSLEECGGDAEVSEDMTDLCDKVRQAGEDGEGGDSPAYVFDSPLKAVGPDASSLLSDLPAQGMPSFMRMTVGTWGHEAGQGNTEAKVTYRTLKLLDRLIGTASGKARPTDVASRIVHLAGGMPLTRPSPTWPEELPLVMPSPSPNPQFYLGGPGTGAPWHYHKDAWNALAAGEKRWYLLPLHDAVYSTQPAAAWLTDDGAQAAAVRDSDAVLECTQLPGDIVYVPYGWGHAVLNTGRGVTTGVALEFSSPLRPVPLAA